MTQLRLFFICLACLLLAACGTAQPTPTRTATAIAQAQVTDTAVLPTATATALPTTNTNMPTETTMPVTNTPTLFPAITTTPPPTAAPTIIPTPLPPPPGEIYFFLDPDSVQQEYEKFSFNFYRAVPGNAANEWQIESILTGMNLEGPAITVSPDRSRLALLLLDDTDGDGKLVHNTGGDIRNIYIYDVAAHSIERLTNNESSALSVSWLPGSQAVTYPQSEKVFTVYLADGSPRLVLQLPVDHIGQLTWSLDGQKLFLDAVRSTPTTLLVYEPYSGNLLYPTFDTGLGGTFLRWWSPDGRWLAFTQYGAQVYDNWRYVAVMNEESLEVFRLVFGEDYMSSPPDWSMDSQWLAFTKNESVLSLWNAETFTVTDVLSGTNMSIPVWSPLENRLAVALVEDGTAKILTFDSHANMITSVFQSQLYQTIKLFDWSPDGEWLLIFAASEEQSGLYTVHVASGIIYLVMDTTGGEPPWELIWVPIP